MQTQREQLIAFHWGIKLSFSNSLDLLASWKIFSEQMQLTVLWFSVKWKLLSQLSCSFCREQKTQIIEVLYTLGAVGVGKYSVLIIGLTREGNKSFLITSLVDYMFPHSHLSNCLLSWGFFVNEICFSSSPSVLGDVSPCRSTCVCLLGSQQDGGPSTPAGILLAWLPPVLPGENRDKMDPAQSTQLNVDYFLCIWLVWSLSFLFPDLKIIEELKLWGWCRKT